VAIVKFERTTVSETVLPGSKAWSSLTTVVSEFKLVELREICEFGCR